MIAPNLQKLAIAMLFVLYEHAAERGGYLSSLRIKEYLDGSISNKFIESAGEILASRGLIHGSYSSSESEPAMFDIKTTGIEYVQNQLGDLNSPISRFKTVGIKWLEVKPTEQDGEHQDSNSNNIATIPSFTKFRDDLLIALASRDTKEGPRIFDLKGTADLAELKYLEGWVQKAAYSFRNQGYINDSFTMGDGIDGNLKSQLTAEGMEIAEKLMVEAADVWDRGISVSGIQDRYEEANDYFDDDEFLVVEESTSAETAPASDRIVRLDHNSSEYREALDAVEAVIEAVTGDNEYGESAPEERDVIVSLLATGRKILDQVEVRVSVARAALIPALQFVAENFSKGAIAALGATAVAAVGRLFGLL
jgi:hypothetical protein